VQGRFTLINMAHNCDDMGPERTVFHATISDLVVDLRVLEECVKDMSMGDLAGSSPYDAGILAPAPQYARPGISVEARREEVARERPQRG